MCTLREQGMVGALPNAVIQMDHRGHSEIGYSPRVFYDVIPYVSWAEYVSIL